MTSPNAFRLVVCVAAALALPLPAGALQIDGLPPFAPIAVDAVTPIVADDTLEVALPEGRRLAIAPWPVFLPQRFGTQSIEGGRRMQPAGPLDRLTFRRAGAEQSWMEIVHGARHATPVVGAWQLQLSRKRWVVAQGRMQYILGENARNARSVTVRVGKDRWCIYLLDSRMPQQQAGIAGEEEAQADWAAVRLAPVQKRCAAQR